MAALVNTIVLTVCVGSGILMILEYFSFGSANRLVFIKTLTDPANECCRLNFSDARLSCKLYDCAVFYLPTKKLILIIRVFSHRLIVSS